MSKLFYRSFIVLTTALLVASGFFVFAGTAMADTTLTPATGGSAISADTTGGSYTNLAGPVITENAVGEIGMDTIVLTAPAGFEFNVSQNVTATRTNAGPEECTGGSNRVLYLDGGISQVVAPTAGTVSFNVTQASEGNPQCRATITFTNIQVRPTTGVLPNSGNITHTGTSIIAGVDGTTNFGALTEVVGAVSPILSTIITTPGNASTDAGPVYQITITVKDQFGNFIVGLPASSVVLSVDGAGNTLVQPSLATDANGQTVGLLGSSKAEVKHISATVNGVLLSVPAIMTFVPGVFHHITVTPTGPQSVEYGNTIAFSAQGYDINNNAIPGLVYAYSVVPGTGTGTVDSDGLFTATNIGAVVVRATSGAISGDSGTITIIPRPITVTADPKTKIYGQSDPPLTYQITSGSLVDDDSFTGELTRVAGEDVGIYAIEQGTLTLSDNYDLTYVGADFEITPAALTISATADNKVYDGTTDATAHLTIEGLVDDDEITADYANANFDNKNVGTGKTVTVTGITIAGPKSGNYTFNDTATTATDITVRPIAVTAVTDTKVYDGTNSSSGSPTITSGSLATGDTATWTQTFDNKNVGVDKILTPSGTVNDGNDGNNYSYTFVNDPTGVITAKDLAITVTGVDKVYDGTTTATVIYGDNRIAGDVFTVSGSASFDTKDIGTDKPVSVVDISISETDAGNYNLTNTTTSTIADITARPITVTADAKTKIYGDADPELTYTVSDDPTLYGDSFSDELTREAGEDVGTYAILQGSLALTSNYVLTYNGADFTITKAMPVITWDNPDDITYPTPLSGTQLNATADVGGTFVYTPDFGAILPAGLNQLLSVTFTPDDIVNYDLATMTVNINVLKGTPVITWANPADVVAGTVLGATQLNAVADVGGVFTYNPPAGTQLTAVGTHPLSVNFVPSDDSYNSASADVSINVYPATIYKLTVSADNLNPTTADIVNLTVNGYDQYDNMTINQSGTAVVISADNGGALGAGILTLNNGEATTILNKSSAGAVNVTVSSGSLIPGSVVVTFTPADSTGPNIITVNPSGSDVSISAPLFFTTNEPLKSATVNSTNVQLWKAGSPDEQVPAVVSLVEGGERVNISPDSSLGYSTSYYFVITSGITDEAGNALTTPKDSSNTGFTTAENTADLMAPTVVVQYPASSASNVVLATQPSIDFSEAMDVTTLTSANIKLVKDSDASEVSAMVVVGNGATRAIIQPASPLEQSAAYHVAVTTDVKDVAGNSLAEAYTGGSFTTTAVDPLVVDEIVAQNNYVVADDTYINGWHYIFRVTINSDETLLQAKFDNWINSADADKKVIVNGNTRLLFNSAGGGIGAGVGLTNEDIENGFGSVNSYSLGNEYSDQVPPFVDTTGIDNNLSAPGRQIQFDVFFKIPTDTTPGFYTTTYGVQIVSAP